VSRPSLRRLAAGALALGVLAVGATGCAGTAVTADRLEESVASSFTRTYTWQQELLGRPQPHDLKTQARCVRGTSGDHGAGSDWTCTVQYLESAADNPVTFSYDVSVHQDLCWTAENGPRALGGATIETAAGTSVPNPVYAVDSCFQP